MFISGLARIRDAEWLQDQMQSISTKVCMCVYVNLSTGQLSMNFVLYFL